DVEALLRRALERGEVGGARVDDEAIAFLAERAAGDARTALAALELGALSGHVTLAVAEDALQRRAVRYDKAGDQHYDLISAWIKSTRGSDPDASLYYLAVMIEGGEDPRFIVRRMVILASEDIGNADPQALQVAVAAAQAVEHVGMPEAHYALAQAAVYLALAPKSDASGRALHAARAGTARRAAADRRGLARARRGRPRRAGRPPPGPPRRHARRGPPRYAVPRTGRGRGHRGRRRLAMGRAGAGGGGGDPGGQRR